MLWPTLRVQDVDVSLAFYRDKLGYTVDLREQDANGTTFLGSVEVDDTVIMFESPDPGEQPVTDRGARSGVTLTILLPAGRDIDAFYAQLRATGVRVRRGIGDRPWGNRDFAVRDPDGYCLIFAAPSKALSNSHEKRAALEKLQQGHFPLSIGQAPASNAGTEADPDPDCGIRRKEENRP